MPELKTYAPSMVALIVGGSIINSWNTVTVEPDEDRNLISVGTSGEVTRSVNQNRLSTITITLPQTSSDNAILSALEIANGVFPVAIVDRSGTFVALMPEGVMQKAAKAQFGKNAVDGDREWTVKGAVPAVVGGGN